MKVKLKLADMPVTVLAVLLAFVQAARCDLYIFSKDKDLLELNKQQRQKDDINYRPAFDSQRGLDSPDDKLYLFPNAKSCMDQMDFDVYFKSADRAKFCSQHCASEHLELPFRTTTASPYIVEYSTPSFDSSAEGEDGVRKDQQLSASGVLHYYRSFIHVFLEKLKHEETNDENSNFKVNIELSRLQIVKLQRFSESVNETDAAGLIQEATYILKSMLHGVDHYRPESVLDSVRKVFAFNLAQYAFVILAAVTSFIVAMLRRFGFKRFTWKNLLITLLFVAFASSVFNNHIILNQKKQILRQQKLKEIIPDECFLNSNEQQHQQQQQQKSGGFTKAVFQVFKKYLGHSPTSKSCLEYQEALFINSYQSNIAETIMYTFFESIRPVAISFGDFINQFHVALVKDLSFYQAIPLLVLVTIILVPVLLYLMSFLFLVLFNYEFNFFHLISFKKSHTDKQQLNEIKAALMNQKKEMIKALRMIRQENAKIAATAKCEAVKAVSAGGVESLASLTYSKEERDKSLSPLKPPSVYTEIPRLNTSEYDDDADDEEGAEMNLSSNVSAMLDRTLETLFENITNKEQEFAEQISQLLAENKKLKGDLTQMTTTATTTTTQQRMTTKQPTNLPFPLPPQQFKALDMNSNTAGAHYQQNNSTTRTSSSHSPPTAAQKGSSASPAHRKPTKAPAGPGQSPQTPSKIISIGPNKTVRPLVVNDNLDPAARRVRKSDNSLLTDSIESSTERLFRKGSSDQNEVGNKSSNQTSPTSYRANDDEDEDEDDDEDIYVILEDK